MASSWGSSWAGAWGNSWGAISGAVEAPSWMGGGFDKHSPPFPLRVKKKRRPETAVPVKSKPVITDDEEDLIIAMKVQGLI